MRESTLTSFQEVIDRAERSPQTFSEQARLILLGQITFAVARGELTVAQGQALDTRLGNLRRKYPEAYEVSIYGDLLGDQELAPT